MDKEKTYNIAREVVLVFTDSEVIEGTLCYHQGMRLSDALNAPAAQRDRPNLALVDAIVTSIETGQELLRARFLMVARAKISVILPKSEALGLQLGYAEGARGLATDRTSAEVMGVLGAIKPEVRATATAIPSSVTGVISERAIPRTGSTETLQSIDLDDKNTLAGLIEALKNIDPLVRKGAVMALANMGPNAKPAVSALVATIKDRDELVRRQSIVALGNIGPEAKAAVPTLIEALQDTDELVRRQAVVTLGNIGPAAKEAVPALIDSLKDDCEFVRGRAADALGRIGPEATDAVPALNEALEDGDMIVRHWASMALERIHGKR